MPSATQINTQASRMPKAKPVRRCSCEGESLTGKRCPKCGGKRVCIHGNPRRGCTECAEEEGWKKVFDVEEVKAALGDAPAQVVVADPPWSYGWSPGVEGNAKHRYRTVPDEDIGDVFRAAREITAENAILLVWVTCPKLDVLLELYRLRSCGWAYKTVAWVWIKTFANGTPYKGLGRHTRSAMEFCLLFTKGAPASFITSTDVDQVLVDWGVDPLFVGRAPISRHSAKPDAFWEDIGKLYHPFCRVVEMFSRTYRPRCFVFGDESLSTGPPTKEDHEYNVLSAEWTRRIDAAIAEGKLHASLQRREETLGALLRIEGDVAALAPETAEQLLIFRRDPNLIRYKDGRSRPPCPDPGDPDDSVVLDGGA